jgi:hypothetical protein
MSTHQQNQAGGQQSRFRPVGSRRRLGIHKTEAGSRQLCCRKRTAFILAFWSWKNQGRLVGLPFSLYS